MKNQTQIIITKLEESIMLIILSCIQELDIKVGINKLIAILQGSKSNYIFENKFNENSYYGFLQNYNSNQIKSIINRLQELNLIEFVDIEKEYYKEVIDLTNKGINGIDSFYIKNPQFFEKIIKIEKSDLNNISKVLFEKLRIVRKEIAQSIGKPAFIVCSDKVLREVASKKPKSSAALLKIKGIGEHFIEQYSSLFLNEIELSCMVENKGVA